MAGGILPQCDAAGIRHSWDISVLELYKANYKKAENRDDVNARFTSLHAYSGGRALFMGYLTVYETFQLQTINIIFSFENLSYHDT